MSVCTTSRVAIFLKFKKPFNVHACDQHSLYSGPVDAVSKGLGVDLYNPDCI
jgi:hypothetical protein